MSHLFEKYVNGKQGAVFIFDGARLFDAITALISSKEKQYEVTYIKDDERDNKDFMNIERLKEELGSLYLEKKMYREFTRNNDTTIIEIDGKKQQQGIKNSFQFKLYEEFCQINTSLACFFLYFFHIFYWNERPLSKEALKSDKVYKEQLVNCNPSGMNTSNILQRIKSVYPYLHNLYVGYLQEKYGDKANIALMNIQDANEQLKEGELLGNIAKIKVKNPKKLTLMKKM